MTTSEARERLGRHFGADALDALEDYVAARVAEAVAGASPQDDGPVWLTLEQAAARLDCSTDAVRMRVKRGRLEPRRDGRRLYVSRASVDGLA